LKDDAKSSRPKRPSKAEQRARMLDQMLDAAEYLFSKHGLYGVTLKDVSERIGVHTSLPHYYFENKKALFDAVVARRAPQSCNTRLEAMDRYEKEAGDNITVEGALRAFLDTDLDNYSKGGEGWRNYGVLGAQVSNTPEWGAEVMDRFFDPVVLRLIDLLKKALPDCPEETIFWGYHFTTGALMLTIGRTGRIDTLSNGLCKSEDFETIKTHMAAFMAAGFKAICHR
jgi:AcrR family transcriptional regulator